MGRVLVGIDGSPASRRAFDHAIRFAKERGDEIVLLTVLPPSVQHSSLASMMPAGLELPPPLSRTFEENAKARLDELAGQLKGSGLGARVELRAGNTVDVFVRLADELGASAIVIGSKAFEPGSVERGPNAEAIAERANVPVTLVP